MPVSRRYDHLIASTSMYHDHVRYSVPCSLLQQVLRLSFENLVYLPVVTRVVMSRSLHILRSEHPWRDHGDVIPQMVLENPLVIRLAQ